MKLQSVLAIFAHPDDETVLAGGIIALLTQQQIPVHIVCATRGEGGETGEPLMNVARASLGSVREQELRCAVQALGATVEILGYIDPLIEQDDVLRPFEANFQILVGQIREIIYQRKPQLILTHGSDGEYGHPAHQLIHQAVVEAVTHNVLLYTVAAQVSNIEDRLWNKSEPAHLALDIRPWADQKLAGMLCHTTQHAMFMRRRQLKTVREAMRTVESVRRLSPDTHDEPPDDAFAQLLRSAGAWTPN